MEKIYNVGMSMMLPPQTNIDRLEAILHHVRRIDQRDKLRTWGAFFRSLLGLIPLAILLWLAWYIYNNSDAILEKITREATRQSAIFIKSESQSGSAIFRRSDFESPEFKKALQDAMAAVLTPPKKK